MTDEREEACGEVGGWWWDTQTAGTALDRPIDRDRRNNKRVCQQLDWIRRGKDSHLLLQRAVASCSAWRLTGRGYRVWGRGVNSRHEEAAANPSIHPHARIMGRTNARNLTTHDDRGVGSLARLAGPFRSM